MINELGTIDILIDDLVSCLKDSFTGIVKETVVFKVETKNLLKDFNEKNGWYINWKEIPKGVDVYALALKEDNSIQGLVGIKRNEDAKAVYILQYLKKKQKELRRFMIMSGIKKADCFSGIKKTEFYNKEINPYELPPKSNYNIGALSEYLIKTGKNIYSLIKDEAEQFVLA